MQRLDFGSFPIRICHYLALGNRFACPKDTIKHLVETQEVVELTPTCFFKAALIPTASQCAAVSTGASGLISDRSGKGNSH